MAHKKRSGGEISKWEASLAAKYRKLFGWSWPVHVQERDCFLNQGCEYLDLELSETDYSRGFTVNSESAAVCFDGAQVGEVHL
jgi:hypothetical protein